jgi:hypothetical protein
LKHVAVFIVLLGVCRLYGTENSKWKLGINVSTDYSYRKLSSDSSSQVYKSYLDLRNAQDAGHFAYTAGVLIRRDIGKHLILESGLLFSDRSYIFKNLPVTSADQPDGTGALLDATFHFRMLSIPLKALWNIPVKNHAFFGSAGLEFQNLISNETVYLIKYSNGTSTKNKHSTNMSYYSKYTAGMTLSGGYSLKFGERYMFSAEPVYRIMLNPLESNHTFKTRLWTLGLNLGLYYSF